VLNRLIAYFDSRKTIAWNQSRMAEVVPGQQANAGEEVSV
jgi:hypothetical protein